jgi:tetratricopeptide (TPR) repeat protein
VAPSGYSNLGVYYRRAGRLDESIAAYRVALRLNPGREDTHAGIGIALLHKGEREAALAEYLLEPREEERLVGISLTQLSLGNSAESDAALQELIDRYADDGTLAIARVLAWRGEADRAFEWLEKTLASGDPELYSIGQSLWLRNLHDDPRWLPLLRRVGVAPEQLEGIEFEVKLPDPGRATSSR